MLLDDSDKHWMNIVTCCTIGAVCVWYVLLCWIVKTTIDASALWVLGIPAPQLGHIFAVVTG